MKTLVIGDIHGRDVWKLIIDQSWDRVIFMGDYWDSKEIPYLQQANNFKEIMRFKEENSENVICLYGNHEFHYHPFIMTTGEHYTGFQIGSATQIMSELYSNMKKLQMCYGMDEFIFSHAGITFDWMEQFDIENDENLVDVVNDYFTYQPKVFALQPGWSGEGQEPYQSPIWVRPRPLIKRGKIGKIQVVGHTPVEKIDIHGKSTGGKFYFIDSLRWKQYIIIEDGQVKLGKI